VREKKRVMMLAEDKYLVECRQCGWNLDDNATYEDAGWMYRLHAGIQHGGPL
jgi:hypothetical protein